MQAVPVCALDLPKSCLRSWCSFVDREGTLLVKSCFLAVPLAVAKNDLSPPGVKKIFRQSVVAAKAPDTLTTAPPLFDQLSPIRLFSRISFPFATC